MQFIKRGEFIAVVCSPLCGGHAGWGVQRYYYSSNNNNNNNSSSSSSSSVLSSVLPRPSKLLEQLLPPLPSRNNNNNHKHNNKYYSPLEGLRPPPAPTATDARPFGTLNRNNRAINYVNINAVGEEKEKEDNNKNLNNNINNNNNSPSGLTPPVVMGIDALTRRHTTATTAAPFSNNNNNNNRINSNNSNSNNNSNNSNNISPTASTVLKAKETIKLKEEELAEERRQKIIKQKIIKEADAKQNYNNNNNTSTTASSSSSSSSNNNTNNNNNNVNVYKEHCTIGWSQEEFYRVVADVEEYKQFLPWCLRSDVHTAERIRLVVDQNNNIIRKTIMNNNNNNLNNNNNEIKEKGWREVCGIEMTATLEVGFSFFKEEYTSRVTLIPSERIIATLYEDEEDELNNHHHNNNLNNNNNDGLFFSSFFNYARKTAKKKILNSLKCVWDFKPIKRKKNEVEVIFSVSFEFKNPIHSTLIMNNIVTLMTRCFERRCESLYGPPSISRQPLPLPA